MKIFIGKIGQKLYFNRNAKEAKRNNMNGNIDAYQFYKFLFTNYPEHEFHMIGACDEEIKRYSNVIVSNVNIKANFDLGLIYGGVYRDTLYDYITLMNTKKWYLFTTDPRCLMQNINLNKLPEKVFAPTSSKVIKMRCNGKDEEVQLTHMPLERLVGFDYEVAGKEKKDLSLVISTSYSELYHRERGVLEMVEQFADYYGEGTIRVYGRISGGLKQRLGNYYKGLLDYADFMSVFKRAKYTYCIPSYEGWATSKYIEALQNDVMPIFRDDYPTQLITKDGLSIKNVSITEDVEAAIDELRSRVYINTHKILKSELDKILQA